MKYFLFIVTFFLMVFFLTPDVRAAVSGSLIKSNSNNAVYYLADGKRYAFPNEKVFFSWYNDFSGVITISPTELASYQLAGNVTYRPGKWLVKIQTDPKVYAVSRYGSLRWVTTEQIATSLYGTNWNTKVHDVPDTFFINYQIGTPIQNAQDYSVQTELTITQITQNIPGVTVPLVVTNPYATIEQKTFDLINQHRVSKGLSPLTWSPTVADASREHSENMASGKVSFGHTGFAERIDLIRKTISLSGAAENVAYNAGYSDPASVAVDGWLKSPDHLANIENGTYNQTGIGVAKNSDDDYYFTQIFIKAN